MEPLHPGEHLAEELEALQMSAAALSRQLGVPTNRVTQIWNGRRAITGDTALRLAHFFGTSPAFWLNLQSLYELRLAEQKSGPAIQALPTLRSSQTIHPFDGDAQEGQAGPLHLPRGPAMSLNQ